MEKKYTEQWINQGKKTNKGFVFYQNKVLDLTQFMSLHPGGVKAISNYLYKDITKILFQVFPHQRETTLHRLMRYQVGCIPDEQVTYGLKIVDKRIDLSARKKQKKKVSFKSDQEKLKQSIKVSKSPMSTEANRDMKQSILKDNTKEPTPEEPRPVKVKSKQKQFITSIRVITEQSAKSYDEYFKENQEQIRQKQRAVTELKKNKREKSLSGSCSFINDELDEEKPNFRVPILCVKQINKYH